MAGFTPQSIQAALPGVLNMALAGGMDLGESADIGSNILSQFTLPAGEMDRVSDVLTAAFTRTTDLRSLGDTMKYAGPVASKLGISLEEAAGMAGILANNGLRGSDAGTAMRASLARLASPTAGAAKALKQLGVSVSDARGKCDQLKLFFSTSTRQLKNTDKLIRLDSLKTLPGKRLLLGCKHWLQAREVENCKSS
jgi:TP901 family phage tail tape measure protein